MGNNGQERSRTGRYSGSDDLTGLIATLPLSNHNPEAWKQRRFTVRGSFRVWQGHRGTGTHLYEQREVPRDAPWLRHHLDPSPKSFHHRECRDDDKESEITAKVVELIESVIDSTGTPSRTLPGSARSKEAHQHRQT